MKDLFGSNRSWRCRYDGAFTGFLACVGLSFLVLTAHASEFTDQRETGWVVPPETVDERGSPVAGVSNDDGNVDPGASEVVGEIRSDNRGVPMKLLPEADPSYPPVSLEWYMATYGSNIGISGMVVGDLDGDGDRELLTSGSSIGFYYNNHWYAFDHDGSSYKMSWAALPYDETIFRLTAAQADGDAALEIVVALDGRLLIYDGLTLDLQVEIAIPTEFLNGMDLANVDGDPAVEVAVCDYFGTWIYDLDDEAQQLDLSGFGCTDLAIGETDGTPGLEIVIANGSNAGLVVNAMSGAVEWNHPLGFGDLLALEDLDGDTMDEVVACFSSSGLQVWNGDNHAYAWGVSASDVSAFVTGDLEGDGPMEVVYASDVEGRLYVLNGSTGVEKWSMDNSAHAGVFGISMGDIDDNGVNELYFGGDSSLNAGHSLYVIDTVAHSVVWQSLDFKGPFLGLTAGDVDADGDNELVFTCYESNRWYDDGLYFVHDAVTKELEYHSGEPTGYNSTGLWDLELANVDADPEKEIFLPTSSGSGGVLQCRDGGSHIVQWEVVLPSNSLTFGSIEIADPDGDGVLEAVSGVRVNSTGAPGVYVYLHDAETGALDWESFDLQSFFGFWGSLTLLRVSDIDSDLVGEVLVAQRGGDLVALDPVANTIDMATAGLLVTALEIADVDGIEGDEIVIGTENGFLQSIDPLTGNPTSLGGPFLDAIDGLAIAELTGDSVPDFVFASGDKLHLVDGSTMLPVWVSDDLGEDVGRHDSLVLGDFDRDNFPEIWVNAGPIGHFIFEVGRPLDMVFRDGFERGDTTAWAVSVP